MADQNKKAVSVPKNYSEDLAKKLVMEVNKYLDEAEVRHGTEFAQDLLLKFLCTFVGYEVHKSLTNKPNGRRMTKKEEFDLAAKNFTGAKVLVQEAISSAFGIAMTNYGGQSIEYYCQIKPIPPIANKEPC